MMADWLANVVAYSLQLAALIASTVGVLHLFPIVNVRWRLRVYQGVFAMAVLLPPLQLWLSRSTTYTGVDELGPDVKVQWYG